MTDWLRVIDRGICIRQDDGDPPVFTVEEISRRLAGALNESETDEDKLRLMNICFDALVCLRELEARRAI
jgi:hypothetical protein